MDLEVIGEGDFLLTQNYVIQLCAEGVITSSDFLLYCFYRSISGFKEIKCGYEYISLNTGLSKGVISAGNNRLLEAGLIKLRKFGYRKTFQVFTVPGTNLPRRKLKKVERELEEEDWIEKSTDKYIDKVSDSFKRTTKYNLYDYRPSPEILEFIEKFVDEWCSRSKTGFYYKNDYKKLEEIDVKEAMKYIPVMWSLDGVDDWVDTSDHVISVFVELFKQGKLQNHYPKTKYYYIDKQKEEEE